MKRVALGRCVLALRALSWGYDVVYDVVYIVVAAGGLYLQVCCDVKFLQRSSSLSSLDPLLDRRIVAFICFSHSFTSPPYTEAASPKALVV